MGVKHGEVIWRVDNGSREGVAVTKVPFLATVHDARNGKRYRGGQCIAVTETEITVRFHAETSDVRTATIARNLKPIIRKGDPVGGGVGEQRLQHRGAARRPVCRSRPSQPGAAVDAGFFNPSRITDDFWNL